MTTNNDRQTDALALALALLQRPLLQGWPNNTPKEEVKELLKFESDMLDRMMEDDTDMDTTVTKEDFEDVIGKFKKKN